MNNTAKQWLVAIGIITTVVIAWYLLIELRKPTIIPGSFPIKQYEIHKEGERAFLKVVAAQDVQLSELVDLQYFEPLKPGDTQEDAVRKLGQPTNLREESSSSKIMEFEREGYRLEVNMINYTDGDSTHTEHLLFTYPVGKSIYDILPNEITDRFDKTNDKSTITIEADNEQHAFITTEGVRVDSVQWRPY